MRSMTGYGRGQSGHDGVQYSVELNSVNRKQSEVTVTLPRELAELEPRVRDLINTVVSRGRLNVVISYHSHSVTAQKVVVDPELARTYYEAMLAVQRDLSIPGEITIDTVLRSPGVLRAPESQITLDDSWPHVEAALKEALKDLIQMREEEGRHLAKDLIHRLKSVRDFLEKIRELQPNVLAKYRQTLLERIQKAGLELQLDDERITKEVVFFADKSDITEETTRLESHFAQFAHHLRKEEPVGRTLDFMTQEISREFNTLGAKANDAEISQWVVRCKSEMEKIREQIQNIE